MDMNGLVAEILSNRARYTAHAFGRIGQRSVNWTTIRASIAQGYEVIEDYPNRQPKPTVLLLSKLPDKRPLHTVWTWDSVDPAELVTVYLPDEPAYRRFWTNGYRVRVRPQP